MSIGTGEGVEYPQVDEYPRNGTFRRFHDGGEQVEIEGELRDGVRVGTWRWYYPNGQLHWEIEHVDGLKEGRETGWHENGEKMYEGDNAADKRTGSWTWWHDNGEFKQTYHYDEDGEKHGEYVWDQPDGSPKARGEFLHGVRHGKWTWWDSSGHEKVVRGYHKGINHGENAAWYRPGGRLAYRRQYDHGAKVGEEVAFYEDGCPKLEVSWENGYVVGEKRTWDEDGDETVEVFVDGLPEELAEDTELMEKTAKKLAKAKDNYAKDNVLKDAAGYGERGAYLVKLVREGVVDVAADRHLWERYAAMHQMLEVEEVVALLENARGADEAYAGYAPGWPREFDELTMRFYARDPEPFRAVVDELSEPIKRGVALVMARFGDDVSDIIDDPVEDIAAHHFERGFSNRLWWPTEDGVEQIEILDGTMPNENFDRFIEMFTTLERWAEVMLELGLEEAEESTPRIRFPKVKHAIEIADVEQMSKLLGGISLDGFSIEHTRQALLEWRDDDAEEVAQMARAIDGDGLRKWPTVACAIVKLNGAGQPIPQDLVDALELYGGTPALHWVRDAINQIDDPDHKKDLAVIDRQISFAEPGFGFPKLDLLFDALATLSEEQRRGLLERQFEQDYGKADAAPYLHIVNDPELWQRGLDAILEDNSSATDKVAFGLAHLPLGALTLLEAASEKASKQEIKKTLQRAMIGLMASAIDRGESWDEQWDERIEFDAAQQTYDYPQLRPLLMKVVYNLPRERALEVLRRELARPSTFARAFRFIGAYPDQELAEYAFTQLRELEASLNNDAAREIQAGLEHFPNVRPWVKWLLAHGAGSHLKQQFMAAVGRDAFQEIEEELAAQGQETAQELDDVDKLVRLAEKVGGTGETIYILRRLDEAPDEPGLNRIGGLPPGIGAERWPTFDDEPMAHLYTLDLETVPAFAKQYEDEVRAVSVFCHHPEYNEAWEPYNGWTSVVFSTDEDVAQQDLELPDDIPESDEAWFEPVPVEVDPEIWQADSDNELRNKIYSAHARVGGEPIWLQYPDHGGPLVMQVDERFAYMNLGDMGVMYVFNDTAFWQCH